MRARAKTINFATIYGQGPFALSRQLSITQEQARDFIKRYFERFAGVRAFLDASIAKARERGYAETIEGRRRYIPELQAANPRVRDLGRRQALNAPIQGSASDVFKVGMIAVDRALREHPDLDCHMLLTVHDELVFEVRKDRAEEAVDLIRDRMEHAVELDVDLRADVGLGANWSAAAPEGH